MPTHAEQRLLPYSPEQLFDLVADIERYPEFLPWCVAARIRERTGELVVADLMIGFKMIRERFTSRVR
ncbi:type II toxin-antitoxin system RatA family toxin, partial [Stella sp.]|uniref:type II toxin-antitoxin system RatA family toxin n=1 Tax=Stella sp. TaxID=2912054 RepID=UPI0035B288B4